MKDLYNLFLFVAICFVVYAVFSSFHYNPMLLEGMTTASKSEVADGIAGNAAAYASSLKAFTIKSQDQLLISKYRADYETAILNMDDLLNNVMLRTVLTVNPSRPEDAVAKLANLQQAKTALNTVMKFVDSQ